MLPATEAPVPWLLLLVLACKAKPDAPVPPPRPEPVTAAPPASSGPASPDDPSGSAAGPTDSEQARAPAASGPPGAAELARRLSARDRVTCTAALKGIDDPVPALAWVVDEVPLPPSAGMRAAQCLVEAHAQEGMPILARWMVEDGYAGVARLVLGQLPDLPERVALKVVAAGLQGPLADEVAAAARQDARPTVRAQAP